MHHTVKDNLTAVINIYRCKSMVCMSPFFTYPYWVVFHYFKIIKTNSKVEIILIYNKPAFFFWNSYILNTQPETCKFYYNFCCKTSIHLLRVDFRIIWVIYISCILVINKLSFLYKVFHDLWTLLQ